MATTIFADTTDERGRRKNHLLKDRLSLAILAAVLTGVTVIATGPMWATAATDGGGLPPGVGANFAHETLLNISQTNDLIGSVTITTPESGTLMATATAYVSHVKAPLTSGAACRLILDKNFTASNYGRVSVSATNPVASIAITTSWPGVSAGQHTIELECWTTIRIQDYDVALWDAHLNAWEVA
jgi:hypothetical protein